MPMDLKSHVLTTKTCEDQGRGKGSRRYGLCSSLLVCASPCISVAVWTPLPAPLTLLNIRLRVECIYSYSYSVIYSLINQVVDKWNIHFFSVGVFVLFVMSPRRLKQDQSI